MLSNKSFIDKLWVIINVLVLSRRTLITLIKYGGILTDYPFSTILLFKITHSKTYSSSKVYLLLSDSSICTVLKSESTLKNSANSIIHLLSKEEKIFLPRSEESTWKIITNPLLLPILIPRIKK